MAETRLYVDLHIVMSNFLFVGSPWGLGRGLGGFLYED